MRVGDLVCLVHLVYPVSLVQPSKQDKLNKSIKRDRPNRPNEQDRLTDFFSILLLRKRKLGQFRLVETLLHQCADIEHPFDLLNIIEPGFRAGVRRGEE